MEKFEDEIRTLSLQVKSLVSTQQFYNRAFSEACKNVNSQNPNSAQLLLTYMVLIDNAIMNYANSSPNQTNIKNGLTQEQSEYICNICSKATKSGNMVSNAATGAALGGTILGGLGLIGGAIIGGLIGSSNTNCDQVEFNRLLNEAIDYYFQCIYLNSALPNINESIEHEPNNSPVVKADTPKKPEKSCENPQEKLDQLIGLSAIKQQIKFMKASLKKQKSIGTPLNMHMCFYGNPGTGKTEVARLIADLFYKEGLLPSNTFIETDRSGLIGEYLGQSAPKTHELFNKAMGGVLFIDEAYTLADAPGAIPDPYAHEAVAALLKDMEDNRGKICVILAGYRKEMEQLFKMNPGFKSRINRYIDFPDYSRDELLQILNLFIKKKKYEIDNDAAQLAIDIVMSRQGIENFSNAREVRNIIDSLIDIQAFRTEDDLDNRKILLCDVKEYMSLNNIVCF